MHPVADLLICLRFFSRLPLPATRREIALGASGLTAAAWMAPLAGALVGSLSAIVLLAAESTGLPPSIAAPIAIGAALLVTGALHEDGLADCADGFGGGTTRGCKLEIMRDSRIGAFGACSVVLSLYLRAAALCMIATRSPWAGAIALVLAGALSRTGCLAPLVLLPPARADGAGSATRPSTVTLGLAVALASIVTICCLGLIPAPRLAGAWITSVLVTLGWCLVARRQIGGQTGDVAGAAQQIVEIAVLVTLSAS